MVNLFSIDTNNITKDDIIEYEIKGKIKVYNGQIIDIDKKGMMR